MLSLFYQSVSFLCFFFFFSSRRRHTRCLSDWSSDVCSSDLEATMRVETAFRARLAEQTVGIGVVPGAGADRGAARPLLVVVLVRLVAGRVREIGRASCRERV